MKAALENEEMYEMKTAWVELWENRPREARRLEIDFLQLGELFFHSNSVIT